MGQNSHFSSLAFTVYLQLHKWSEMFQMTNLLESLINSTNNVYVHITKESTTVSSKK